MDVRVAAEHSRAERVWRLRKDHVWIDARIRPSAVSDAVDLQFFYDGVLVSDRRWPSRATALADADERRREFQRAGWSPHW